MTFLEIRQRIAEQLGLDSSDTQTDNNATLEAKFEEWVNARYRLLAGKRSWNWLLKDSIIQTRADITTGTVTATNDSTTITFSSAPTVSATGFFIQFSDSDDWYEISSHTANVTTATLTVPYLGTTSSTLTYILRKIYYVLPTDCSKILNLKQTRDDISLRYVSPRRFDELVSDRTRTGEPEFYSIVGVDSSRQYKMEFYPVPNVAMNINVRYYRVAAELSADGDVPLIPEAFHDFLVWDVLGTYGFSFLDDTRISAALAEANRIYDDMVKNDIATENIAVRAPFDAGMYHDSDLSRLDLPIE